MDKDKLQELLETRAQADLELEKLRTPVTILFSDIKGSTRYAEKKGDFEYMEGADNWCFKEGALERCNDFWLQWEMVAEAILKERSGGDRSFLEFLSDHPEFDDETRKNAISYVEGFNAAQAERIGLEYLRLSLKASTEVGGDTPSRILSGYDTIVDWLASQASGVKILLNTLVEEVRWRDGYVQIDGLEAEQAIITLPLGVLQAETVRFFPDVPEKRTAAQQLIMGQVTKIILSFRSAFWKEDRKSVV